MRRFDFVSDNVAGAMPEALRALCHCNEGFAAAYGEDGVSARAGDLIRALLDVDAEVRFIASGTAANALSLAALAAPHEAVLAHAAAHAAIDETGAPGFFGGGLGITPLAGASGKIAADSLAAALAAPDEAHFQAAGALSLTNATEYGTVYSATEMAELAGAARAAGVKTHLDGARLANAAAAGFDIRSLNAIGVAIAVVGGTKAGGTPSEAIVINDPALRRRIGARLKHAGQLVSKSRFLAAPWIGMLEDGAWLRRAAHANAMAARLAAASPFPLAHAQQTNAVFLAMDAEAHRRLVRSGWRCYRVADGSVRLMCSWATSPEAVDELIEALKAVR